MIPAPLAVCERRKSTSCRGFESGKSQRPDLAAEAVRAVLREQFGSEHPDVKLAGCESDDCDCVRIDGDGEQWSVPVVYEMPDVLNHHTKNPENPDQKCGYTFSGTYAVQAGIFEGICMRASTVDGE
jgi:hypothetical protein